AGRVAPGGGAPGVRASPRPGPPAASVITTARGEQQRDGTQERTNRDIVKFHADLRRTATPGGCRYRRGRLTNFAAFAGDARWRRPLERLGGNSEQSPEPDAHHDEG